MRGDKRQHLKHKEAKMKVSNMIIESAELIKKYNVALGLAFVEQPLRRVDLAYAFAAGFAKADTDDIHPHADLVIRVALADKEIRRSM